MTCFHGILISRCGVQSLKHQAVFGNSNIYSVFDVNSFKSLVLTRPYEFILKLCVTHHVYNEENSKFII